MTPQDASRRLRELCNLAPVIPVLVIDDAHHARPLAEALVAGGLPVLEVTLRTPAALDAIGAMADVPGASVGAGFAGRLAISVGASGRKDFGISSARRSGSSASTRLGGGGGAEGATGRGRAISAGAISACVGCSGTAA